MKLLRAQERTNFCNGGAREAVKGTKVEYSLDRFENWEEPKSFGRLSIVGVYGIRSPVCSYHIYPKMYESFPNDGKIANARIPDSDSIAIVDITFRIFHSHIKKQRIIWSSLTVGIACYVVRNTFLCIFKYPTKYWYRVFHGHWNVPSDCRLFDHFRVDFQFRSKFVKEFIIGENPTWRRNTHFLFVLISREYVWNKCWIDRKSVV